MRSAGIDVGRRIDKTSLIVFNTPSVLYTGMQLDGLRFREQAEFLKPTLVLADKILVDVTGLGMGLAEALEDQKLKVIWVTLVSGNKLHIHNEHKVSVGKEYLIYLITSQYTSFISYLSENISMLLRMQMQNFVAKPGRKLKLEAKTGHDDMVIALGLSLLGVVLDG